MKKILPALLCLLAPALASAAALDQLKHFLEQTKTARASFSQQVITKTGRPGQQASGSMSFLRPGKFRWEYTKPYNQLIVGDGSKLWSYDKDLEQVVIKPMGDTLGATPAALLAGSNDLQKNFTLREDGTANGLEWLEATPRTSEAGFERVRIGLKDNLPQAMEVRDNFGQTTMLSFTGFERNPPLPADQFRFTPPPGVDVVGE
ncbi:MAG: outer membrane lipoprotein carrier protein LolA [Candidatus Dactylopiibacterium carminicum]|uniref:Outer-membrane lipoprotein carrier protein n=1 Tax=Candidatus Dactylopiibacterium carminicum TaxID=857335 RepID=A0A272EU19_9RHOO|nr:outer membrane lipoprotein chaperone LolA [Candidatus Dactylopiibacterium carminicum]KAF7599679.1 outer membrane lipoprotein chaperone LolA [Candidatus Dactylopiibacterium carminicum]PAS93595.1 MAG: outer membrane lipoprotein carrier protein LolA [Candidatus Dactylopiibacterium carminicum]PAS99679.1 MAG: outer membrane lipoprotein carrier protein LolA [Candidatus Dactylopiibacterium carminicum]